MPQHWQATGRNGAANVDTSQSRDRKVVWVCAGWLACLGPPFIMASVQNLVLADFADHVQQSFAVSAGPIRTNLDLTEATALKSAHPDGPAPFSLIFRGAKSDPLPQGTYEFTHPRLGQVAIFIVPLGPDSDGFTYQAIFS